MSAQAVTISEFVKEFKEAKTDDERAVTIVDFVKQSQNQAKEETLKEISPQELATKADIYALKNEFKADIASAKTSMLWAVIGICGVWVPAIIGIITTIILKHT